MPRYISLKDRSYKKVLIRASDSEDLHRGRQIAAGKQGHNTPWDKGLKNQVGGEGTSKALIPPNL